MRLSRLLFALALVIGACSSAPAPEQANDLLFAGDQPTPTVVPPGDAVDENTNDAAADQGTRPPTPLAFTDWTIDDVLSRLRVALDEPVTVSFEGQGDEQLRISGDDWAVESDFTTLGQGDQQWVTYSHVEAGILALQSYTASSTGTDIEDLIDNATSPDPIALQFMADRAVLAETSDFGSMWVPYDPEASGFFSASVLTPQVVANILDDASRGLAVADGDGTLVLEPTDSSVSASAPNLEYAAVEISNDGSIYLTSQAGWSIEVSGGVDEAAAIGAPDTRDILSRDLLLTATSAPASCVTPELEASIIVENGLIVCTGTGDLQTLTTTATVNSDSSQDE